MRTAVTRGEPPVSAPRTRWKILLESVVSAVIGTRIRWQHVARTGDVEAAPSTAG